MGRLERSFYARDARDVAEDLLGRTLVHATDAGRLAGRIVETEAYLGPEDPASHARFGRTARAAVMWDRPGTIYVYRIYGVHAMLNLVTGTEGEAEAVLVRAVEPLDGLEAMSARRAVDRTEDLTNGPGKLCEAFGVDLDLKGSDACAEDGPLHVEPGDPPASVERTPRIGVVEDVEEPRRFVDPASRFRSR